MAQFEIPHTLSKSQLPYWSQVLRALRKSRGITQDCWAAQLNYSRATVRRWESGKSVPSADAEREIIALCENRHIFRDISVGPFNGIHISSEWVSDVLAAARLEFETQRHRFDIGGPVAEAIHAKMESLIRSDAQTDTSVSTQILSTLVKESNHPESTTDGLSPHGHIDSRLLCREVNTVEHGKMIACDCLSHALLFVSHGLRNQAHCSGGASFGIHVGEVSKYRDTISGSPVEVCSDLSTIAPANTCFVSSVVAELAAGGLFKFSQVQEPVGSSSLHGLSVLRLDIS